MDEKYKKGGPLPNSVGALADLYSEQRELRLSMQKSVDAVKERETEIWKAILHTLQESPDSGASGEKYRVQITKKEVFNGKDWPTVHGWIAQTGQFQLLPKSLTAKAVKELYDEYGQLPPGVERDEIDTLSFSKVG